MLKEACDKVAMKKMQIFKKHKCFHDGCASVEDNARCKQPSTSTNAKIIEQMHNVV
jgi:hypothetical protein